MWCWRECKLEFMFRIPANVRKVMLRRYYWATWLCAGLEYALLSLFLLVALLDSEYPGDWIANVFQATLYSLYTWAAMQGVVVGVAFYGILLFKAHNLRPILYRTRFERLVGELPRKCLLLASVIYMGVCSGLLYGSFLEDGMSFLHYYGIVCALIYFIRVHRRFRNFVKLPVVRFDQSHTLQWIWWRSFQLALHENCVSFGILTIWNWDLFWENPRVSLYAYGVGVLITAKLHIVRQMYEMVLYLQLPLVLQNWEIETKKGISVPAMLSQLLHRSVRGLFGELFDCGLEETRQELGLAEALSTNLLYGFQLQASKDFYDMMSCCENTRSKNIFQLDCVSRCPWLPVRDLIFDMIEDFVKKMEICCPQPSWPKRQRSLAEMLRESEKQARLHLGMRPLVPPMPKLCLWKRAPDQEPQCESLNDAPNSRYNLYEYPQSLMCWLKLILEVVIQSFINSVPPLRALFVADICAPVNYELHCAQPLRWLLQGLVCVCERSLHEDKYGMLQSDLKKIFDLLLKVERQLINARELTRPSLQNIRPAKLDRSYYLLWIAAERSLNRLLETFDPYLNHILDMGLQQKLRERSLNSPLT
ncbi:nucleoporin Ndc1-like [Scaptodrosophila lebanonensis]|uniref:Nucleoporin Ndc1-like n=1 Tax=Drosophila lebanonensis TaxID=7225 RepID=A0A6J2U155_DROLE|nr:nucleoporin Ndc1-like [Scaptodrosophila lebanonensis]